MFTLDHFGSLSNFCYDFTTKEQYYYLQKVMSKTTKKDQISDKKWTRK